ncbi:hypothetical protein HKCCE2091_19015 [Rhodobacterales bacterium HKCCE2091]|nr:hypothetical protein [Rhodobacterales bacterium HKCCE2091]
MADHDGLPREDRREPEQGAGGLSRADDDNGAPERSGAPSRKGRLAWRLAAIPPALLALPFGYAWISLRPEIARCSDPDTRLDWADCGDAEALALIAGGMAAVCVLLTLLFFWLGRAR